ncbi:MAG: CapA family protein [Gammaproteobacteria bacterium]|nr:CapA family protein [Gammaproteobacteria bacterium]
MRLSRLRQLLVILAYCLQLAACGGGGGGDSGNTGGAPKLVLDLEANIQNDYDTNEVTLQGILLDQTGAALAGASVSIAGLTVTTGIDGSFELATLARENALMTVAAAGQRTEYLPVYLNQPASVGTITLDPVIVSASQPASARMLFGGDAAFGRRFIDVDESTPRDQVPPDDPDAQILVSDPEPGTRAVLEALRPWYQESDFGVLNFETPVTDNPSTPHEEKAFAFFTLPGSVPALNWLGINYVSLGNNHIYDYLEQGVIDTLAHINSNGIGHSGAGLNSTQAFTAYRTTLSGSLYGFLSMTSVAGSQHTQTYVADATKGGAADLRADADVVAAIQTEQGAGFIPIVQYHTGKEYTYEPTDFVLEKIQLAADNNVPLLIAHHPHVAQGIGLFDNTVAVLGLGNLAFDQARLETMLGLVARVDITGAQVEQVRLLPVYLENYAPQLISGRLASNFLRRIGEFSHVYGALVYPYNNQGWVDLGADAVRQERTVIIDINIPASGSTVADLRAWAHDDESLLELNTASTLTIHMGRDLFGYGDFEDWDSDAQQLDAARWDVSGSSRYLCLGHAYRGTAGLCSIRSSSNSSDSVTPNRNRIRVMGDALDMPIKDLTLFGYIKGENAGPITLRTRYFASVGDLVFGEEDAVTHPGGSFDWQPFIGNLNMPAEVPVAPGQVAGEVNARALRIFIRQSPPVSGDALVAIDELAVIGWEDTITPAVQVQIPHAKDFLRVSGTPGTHQLTLTFGRHVPAVLP